MNKLVSITRGLRAGETKSKVMVYLYPLFAGSILATVLQLPRSQQHSWYYYLRTRKIRYKMKRGRELSCIYSQRIGQNGRRRKALTFPLSLIPIPAPLPPIPHFLVFNDLKFSCNFRKLSTLYLF